MTRAPEMTPAARALYEDEADETPRFAEQRLMAARRANLPERMLLHRARSEGAAHRRSESAEQQALGLSAL